jgi:predicted alpha/beta-hydrolase family hydrolase
MVQQRGKPHRSRTAHLEDLRSTRLKKSGKRPLATFHRCRQYRCEARIGTHGIELASVSSPTWTPMCSFAGDPF